MIDTDGRTGSPAKGTLCSQRSSSGSAGGKKADLATPNEKRRRLGFDPIVQCLSAATANGDGGSDKVGNNHHRSEGDVLKQRRTDLIKESTARTDRLGKDRRRSKVLVTRECRPGKVKNGVAIADTLKKDRRKSEGEAARERRAEHGTKIPIATNKLARFERSSNQIFQTNLPSSMTSVFIMPGWPSGTWL